MEKNLKRNMYVKPNHFAIHVKLTQFCKKKKKFIYFFLAVLGLCCCIQAFL